MFAKIDHTRVFFPKFLIQVFPSDRIGYIPEVDLHEQKTKRSNFLVKIEISGIKIDRIKNRKAQEHAFVAVPGVIEKAEATVHSRFPITGSPHASFLSGNRDQLLNPV